MCVATVFCKLPQMINGCAVNVIHFPTFSLLNLSLPLKKRPGSACSRFKLNFSTRERDNDERGCNRVTHTPGGSRVLNRLNQKIKLTFPEQIVSQLGTC